MYVITVIEYMYMHVCEGFFFVKQSLYTYDSETLHLYIRLLIIYWLFKCGIPSGFSLNFSIISFLTFSCFSLVIIAPSSYLTLFLLHQFAEWELWLSPIHLSLYALTKQYWQYEHLGFYLRTLSLSFYHSLFWKTERAVQALWEAAAFNPQLWFT